VPVGAAGVVLNIVSPLLSRGGRPASMPGPRWPPMTLAILKWRKAKPSYSTKLG
jgi:hypothetical protein